MDVSMSDHSQVDHSLGDLDEDNHTQPLSQLQTKQPFELEDLDAWGLLIPCTPALQRQRLLRTNPEITIGRYKENTLVLPWKCVSGLHAVITWNGEIGGSSVVTITDKSSNGTYLKDKVMGKEVTRVLTQGDEISFGPPREPGKENRPEYRYTYRDLASERRDVHKKYDFAIELGQGTFARVYKALEKGTSRWVAVKVIPQTMRFNLSAAGEATAVREITIMRSLRHPNICEFLDHFENPDKSIDIVLEFVEGGHLGSFIRNTNGGQGLGDRLSCHVTYQLCKAVAFIHKHNITHRDLKPENILLTPDVPPIVKIADFGLAKLVDDTTALRTIVGTKVFMAPEIVTRLSTDSPYTNLVDSWSVGVILFLMCVFFFDLPPEKPKQPRFTGKTPFPTSITALEVKRLMTNRLIEWRHLDERHDIGINGTDFVRELLRFKPEKRMAIGPVTDEHPWLLEHRPTYEIQYPDELESGNQPLTRTPSLSNSGLNSHSERSYRTAVARAATEDPYADDFVSMPMPQPQPNVHQLRASPPVELAARSGRPGRVAQRAGANNNTGGSRPKLLESYLPDSEYERLYAPAPVIDAAGPSTVGGAPKRTFAEMQTDGSSPLTSLASSPSPSPSPPPAKRGKKGKGKVAPRGGAKSKPAGPAPSRPRKVQKKDAPDVETTILRRSTRAAKR
ncbi:kinase-like domain-containing protein [Mycena metata]|uniref:Kinase-like domain-containing protein n=1 Tax=Mycena metata TaxID=1033252 RepID=A0AAD7JDF4_9AGAR|nr:kinase-like domain-containing protein [Mycena metata]